MDNLAMKHPIALFLVACFVVGPSVSPADEAWLLLHTQEHVAVAHASERGIREIARVGQGATYGETEQAIAVISHRAPADPDVLQVIDKQSGKVTATWPVKGYPIRQLSGPSSDVVLTPEFAYFATVRYGKDGRSLDANELGGAFDFFRVSLVDGRLDRFPLGKDCVNPRVVDFAGTPLIYSWAGYAVWRFDAKNSALEQFVHRRDIEDPVISGDSGFPPAVRQYAFADYVPLPGTGVFRLSRLGGLRQILGPDLSRAAEPRTTLDLGSKTNIARIYPAWFRGERAIGVSIMREGRIHYVSVEPRAMRIQWESALPSGVILDTVAVSRDGSIFYVDRDSASISRMSEGETTTLWRLDGLVPKLRLDDTRILASR